VSVTFRFARSDEVPAIARLVSHSFPGGGRTPEWWADQLHRPAYGGGPELAWVGEEGGRLVAACQLHRLREWVAGEALPTMGLGTVAIAPTHRKRGLAGELVGTGMRAALERGDLVSALYPFRISFYQRLGYGLAGRALQYLVPPDSLPDDEGRDRVELAESPEAREAVRTLYARWAAGQTGQIERSERSWQRILAAAERGLVAVRGTPDGADGYALVAYRTDLPPQERYLEVEELVWSTPSARRALYGWLATLGDQWQRILLRGLPSHRLGDWLREPRLPWGSAPSWGLWFPSATLVLGPMFRLLDLRRAWELRAVRPDAALTVALLVQDEVLPGNAGEWRLRLDAGRAVVEKGSGPADLSLRLGVDTLSRLFIGALPPSAAVEAGLATTDGADRLPELDRALRLPEPWTFDRF
jgi:predicted acetyltransferase